MSTPKPASPIVLIVEDYDDTRELMRMILERRGCHVVEAVDGKEAVELAMQMRPKLILMDLNLPVLDGYQATQQILSSPLTRDIPIVAVSAQCNSDRSQRAIDAGCHECIEKPINFNTIEEILRRYVTNPKP